MSVLSPLLDAALQASPDAILIIDRSGRIAFASNAVGKYAGSRSLIGRHIAELVPTRLRELLRRFVSEYFDAPSSRLVGARHPIFFNAAHGGEQQVEIALGCFIASSDAFAILSVRDLSERMAPDQAQLRTVERLERRLQNALSELRIVIEHTPAAIAVLDRQLRYVLASQRWLNDFGLEGEITGKSHLDLFPDLPQRWKEVLARCLAGETIKSDEDTFDRGDGTLDYLRWEVVPWRLVDGLVGGVTIFSEIVTRQKLAEQILRENQQILERLVAERTSQLEAARDAALEASAVKTGLVAAASHDLRQPLHAIALYLDAIRLRAQNLECATLCDKAEATVFKTVTILDTLLDHSRLETGRIKAHFQSVNLRPLVEKTLAAHEHNGRAKGLKLDLDACDVEVVTDPDLLERILDNLIGNAIKFTDKGSVSVRTSIEQSGVRICVSDTGCGIDANDVARVFQPFVQVSNSKPHLEKGYGLGLAICKTIADALKSSLSVQSSLGHGSTFSLDLSYPPEGASFYNGSTGAAFVGSDPSL